MSDQTGSQSKHFKPYEYPTTSVTLLKFADGRLGKVASVTDCLQPDYFHMHLVGSSGSALDDKFTSLKWDGLGKDRWSKLGVPVVDPGDVSDHPYQPQFQAFIDALKKNRPMPLTDFDNRAGHVIEQQAERMATRFSSAPAHLNKLEARRRASVTQKQKRRTSSEEEGAAP